MEVFGLSNVGQIRENNEDFYTIYGFRGDNGYIIVADGMGGHNAGDVASRTAVEIIRTELKGVQTKSFAKLQTEIERAIKKANHDIYCKANANAEQNGMGTTVVIAYIQNGSALIANIGDSRAYLIHDNELKQITTDHSIVEELIQQGSITREEAKTHPDKRIITKALGTDPEVKADFFKTELHDDDVLVLCTDGLSDMVSDEELLNVFKRRSDIEGAVCTLVQQANTNGGRDNITIVGLKYRGDKA